MVRQQWVSCAIRKFKEEVTWLKFRHHAKWTGSEIVTRDVLTQLKLFFTLVTNQTVELSLLLSPNRVWPKAMQGVWCKRQTPRDWRPSDSALLCGQVVVTSFYLLNWYKQNVKHCTCLFLNFDFCLQKELFTQIKSEFFFLHDDCSTCALDLLKSKAHVEQFKNIIQVYMFRILLRKKVPR